MTDLTRKRTLDDDVDMVVLVENASPQFFNLWIQVTSTDMSLVRASLDIC